MMEGIPPASSEGKRVTFSKKKELSTWTPNQANLNFQDP